MNSLFFDCAHGHGYVEVFPLNLSEQAAVVHVILLITLRVFVVRCDRALTVVRLYSSFDFFILFVYMFTVFLRKARGPCGASSLRLNTVKCQLGWLLGLRGCLSPRKVHPTSPGGAYYWA